jgi:hypothetical protein
MMLRAHCGGIAALLASAACAGGCTQTLDFDSVSQGSQGPATQSNGSCASRMPAPTFCDDFDYGALGDHWLDFEKVNGDYQINSSVSISPPNSLFSSVNPIAATDEVRAVVKTAFPQFAGTRGILDMSFDLYVDQVDTQQGARIIAFALLYGDTSKFYELVFNLNSTGSGASGIVTENTYPEGLYEEHGYLGATHAKWVNVRIEVTVKNPTGVGNPLGVYFDGQRSNSPTDELKAPLIGGSPRIEVGVGWMDTTKGTGGWSVRYENVVINWTPQQ